MVAFVEKFLQPGQIAQHGFRAHTSMTPESIPAAKTSTPSRCDSLESPCMLYGEPPGPRGDRLVAPLLFGFAHPDVDTHRPAGLLKDHLDCRASCGQPIFRNNPGPHFRRIVF